RPAFLLLTEGLERLGALAALQVPNLSRDPLERAGDRGEGRHERGVYIACDHLCGHRVRPQSQRSADVLLHARVHRRVRSDRSADAPDRDLVSGSLEATLCTIELGDPTCDLES